MGNDRQIFNLQDCKLSLAAESCGCVPWYFHLKQAAFSASKNDSSSSSSSTSFPPCEIFGHRCFSEKLLSFTSWDEGGERVDDQDGDEEAVVDSSSSSNSSSSNNNNNMKKEKKRKPCVCPEECNKVGKLKFTPLDFPYNIFIFFV